MDVETAKHFANTTQAPPDLHLINRADQPCHIASAALTRLRKGLSVSLPDGASVAAQTTRKVAWSLNASAPQGPGYLVLATDKPARFRGEGFYVLTPDATAPFKLKQFSHDTRVVIPLHVGHASLQGTLEIRPLLAGPLRLSAAVIGYTQCGEDPDPTPVNLSLQVQSGMPKIVIADQFDLKVPDQVINSPDGTRCIEVYGPRYRVIDTTSDSLLTEAVGEKPRFSPTGRFIAAEAANNYEIRDSTDGELFQKAESVENTEMLAWDVHDSFVIAGTYRWGAISTRSTLNEVSDSVGINDCAHADRSSEENYRIDLQNNIIMFECHGRNDVYMEYLFTQTNLKEKSIKIDSLVVPTSFFRSWEMIDGLKLSHLNDISETSPLKSFLQRTLLQARATGSKHDRDREPLHVASRGLGNLNLPQTLLSTQEEKRLQDFGVRITTGIKLEPLNVATAIRKVGINNYELKRDKNIKFVEGSDCNGERKGGKYVVESYILSKYLHPVHDYLLYSDYNSRFIVINASCEQGSAAFKYPVAFLHDERRPSELLDLTSEFMTSKGLAASECNGESFFSCDISGELFFERYLVLRSKESAAAAVYDLDQRRLIQQIVDLPSPDVMERLSLSEDTKTLLKLDTDGGFQIFALDRGLRDAKGRMLASATRPNVLLFGRVIDDEVVVWTPSDHFDSTPEGASKVALQFPGRSGEYTLAQFSESFHENDLIRRVMAGERFKPPVMTHFPPALIVKPTFTSASVTAKVQPVGDDPVSEVRVYQDGVMTDTIPVRASAKSLDITIKRLPGARWVAFLARGPSGLFSQPSTFDAGPGASSRRRVHIVSIGIDRYDNLESDYQLNSPASDAARFLKTLEDKAGTSVEIVSRTLLLNEAASREAILAKMSETVGKAEPGDSILLFIAGHGVQDDGKYYLGTKVMRRGDYEHTALRWSDLAGILAKAHTRVSVFLDTCHSGDAGTKFFATNDASVGALLDQAPPSILIFSASKGREEANENSETGGFFTTALINALSSTKTDLNHNGVIEASELYAAVKREVVGATWKATNPLITPQTPWFARNDMVGDYVPF